MLHTWQLDFWSPFIDFKKARDSIKREIIYNVLLEFSLDRKVVS
jgi:hypothetical protein